MMLAAWSRTVVCLVALGAVGCAAETVSTPGNDAGESPTGPAAAPTPEGAEETPTTVAVPSVPTVDPTSIDSILDGLGAVVGLTLAEEPVPDELREHGVTRRFAAEGDDARLVLMVLDTPIAASEAETALLSSAQVSGFPESGYSNRSHLFLAWGNTEGHPAFSGDEPPLGRVLEQVPFGTTFGQ
jgi:hypothetical protein